MTEKNGVKRVSGDKTREGIIRAARKLFAKQGYAATSISQIAKLAKINHSLIFHHFETKAKLWVEVKNSFLEALHIDPANLPKAALGLEEFVRQFIEIRFRLWLSDVNLVRMILWQSLEANARELRASALSPYRWKYEIIALQERGEIKPELDPELVCIFIASSVSSSIMTRSNILKDKDKLNTYKALVINSVIDGLKP
ncbi:MAG: TetR/AcrR family transcriptional regulator [Gammaproteobacteria bacterium]|nr:TetR/AcrR family transcriptional regulator [Gammaproteobacteria bacterium]